MEKKMIIVGAGIAGLSTGIYARMNGYRTTILEMHNIPGGLCTAWKRKGYTFDISMHMLTNSKSGPLHRMWRELGVVKDRAFVYHTDMAQIESRGKKLIIGADPQKFEAEMIALSPADAELIKEFSRLFYGQGMMGAASLKPPQFSGILDKLKMMTVILPMMGKFRKYGAMTIQEFADKFQDPFLRNAVRFTIDSPGWPMLQYPMIAMAGFFESAVSGAGTPVGGSQQVLFQMAKYYQELGGEIHYQSRVKDLIIENDRAVGVRLEDNTEQRADMIIWAGDGHHLIFDILGGRYVNDEIGKMYREWIPVKPLIHVSIGVARDQSREPRRLIMELEKPINIAGEDHRWLSVIHHCFDPNMAPAGKSAVEVWYPTRYDYWETLARDRAKYEAEKQRIAEVTIAELEKRWPGFASQIEVTDVCTPVTYVRYTGNWQGSPDGWYITPGTMMNQGMIRNLPGLSDLYMVGQWTAPFTGTVLAALSGRQLIQILCKEDKRRFVTVIP